MGVLNVALSDCDEPTAEEREIVDLLASHAAVAIGNARLFAESETRRRAAEALSEVWRFLSETFGVAALGQRMADLVLRAPQVRAAALCRLVPASGDLEVIGRSGEAGRFLDPGFVIPAGHGLVGLAVNRRQPVVTPDIRVDARVKRTPGMQVHHAICPSVLSLPLVVKGQVVGGFTVGDALGRTYSDDDLRLAQTFADQAAVALENARLFEEAERRRRQGLALGGLARTLAASLAPGGGAPRAGAAARERLRRPPAAVPRPDPTARLYADAEQRRLEGETLSGLVRTISATLDLAAVMRHVAAAARELCRSDIAHILLRDAETDTMSTQFGVGHMRAYSTRIERGRGAGGIAWSTGRPFRSANRATDSRIVDHYPEQVAREGVVTTLVVPIWISGQVEGLLYAENRTARVFTDRDEAILLRLADHAAVAIQNATLYQRLQGLSGRLMEVQETERRHLARELHDEIGQLLTGLRLTLDLPEPPSPALGERLEQARGLAEELLDRVRALSVDLRPSILDDLGLLPALLGHAERYPSPTKG